MYAPNYYKNFKCIADKCRHSCCIDWEIRIDEKTLSKYKEIDEINKTVSICDDGACFKLCGDGRCPHLNDDGLCNIIISHGEEYLSEICKNHPRFFNDLGNGRIEAGLGIVCEEACRLVLSEYEPFALEKLDACFDISNEEPGDDILQQRDRIISQLEVSDVSFDKMLSDIKAMYEIPELYSISEWIDIFLGLEILDSDWEKTLSIAKEKSPQNSGQYDIYYKRLLLYFVYRHVSIADSLGNFRARLGFAILSAEMIRHIFETSEELSFEGLMDIARRYSAEIEYSEDNTDDIIFEFECGI